MHFFGAVAGTLAIVVLIKLAVRGHYYRHGWRYGGGYGHGHRHGGYGRRGWGHRGGWRRHALYSPFERLDATPGQEKAISGALDELREKLLEHAGSVVRVAPRGGIDVPG